MAVSPPARPARDPGLTSPTDFLALCHPLDARVDLAASVPRSGHLEASTLEAGRRPLARSTNPSTIERMWRFKRTSKAPQHADSASAAAVLEASSIDQLAEQLPDSVDELDRLVDELVETYRRQPTREMERQLLALRHILAARSLTSGPSPDFVEPDFESLPPEGEIPEVNAAQLTPGVVRAAILRDGFLIARCVVPRDEAIKLAEGIDRAFVEREKALRGEEPEPGYYEEFQPLEAYRESLLVRPWIREGGGVLAPDAPILCEQMIALITRHGIRSLVEGYMRERPLISLQKTTLRKAEPHVPGAWHQDGSFMGEVRALNLWLSLSRCGDESPGLDIVPRRLDHYVEQRTDEAVLSIQVSQRVAEEAAGDRPIIRPIFEPGDAVFFDEMLLHQTGSDPSMPKPRYAVECWFFGCSKFPKEYGPLAV